MFGQKKCTAPQQNDKPKPALKAPGTSRVKVSLLSLESRLMFDAAAAATAAEVNQEQVAQEQAESAVSAEGGGEPTAVENESQELLQAITTYNPGESRTEIVFVDPTVPNYQELLSGMHPNIAVIMLDGGQDGVEQMASALAGRTGIDAIHLISHGSAGELQLGTGTLTTESMSGQYAEELAIIQQALSGQADILVYGCDFAEGQAGQEAATLLSQLTGADVAASTDATGFAALGGDWVLEAEIGAIETRIAVDDGIQANWVGLLAAPVVDLNAGGVGNNVTAAFTEQTSVLIAPVGTLSDVDSANLNQFTVTLTARPNGNAVESLSLNAAATTVASGAGLTVSYTASTGVLLIRGTASTATYQTILQGILYNNTSDQPTTSNRSITVVARDSTNASSTSRTATITVTAVNDASTITGLSGDSRAYSEGAGAVVIESGNAVVADVDSTNFDTGTLTVSIPAGGDSAEDVLSIRHQGTGAGQIGVSGSTVTYQGVTIGTFTGGSSGSNLVITLNSSATPTAVTALVRNITYQNTDTNAPTTGARTVRFVLTDGDGGTSPNYNTTVTVSAVNDAPTDLSLLGDTVTENAANGTLVGTVTGTDPDSGDTKSYSFTDSASGRFAINSATGEITVANSSLLDYESATSHTVTVRVTDSGGLTYDETFTINLTNVNEAPTGADAIVTIIEDTAHTLTTTNFGFSDVDASDSLSAVRIDTLPGAWSLTLSGVAVTPGQVITVADITAGNLVFTPTANANGTGYASCTFSVRDSNNAYDTAPNTLTFNVTAVNDAPTMAVNSGSTVAEDGTDTIDSSELAVTDIEQSAAQLTYSLGTGPAYGRLELTTAPGVSTSTFTQADIIANRLVYVHDGSETTSDSFTFTVTDGAGGTLGTMTMTLTIMPVNDTPTITSEGGASTAAIIVAENVSAVTIVTGADVDLPAQALSYSISGGADQARFTINATTGALSFTAPPNFEVATDADGDNVYFVQVQVIDSQGASTTQMIQVTVTDVAERPQSTPTAPLIPPVLLQTTPPSPTGASPVPSSSSSPAEPPIDALSPSPVLPDLGSTPVDLHPPNPVLLATDSRADRGNPRLPDDLRKPMDLAKDQPLFTVPLVDPAPVQDPEPPEEKGSVSDLLLAKLDELAVSLEHTVEVSEERHVLITRIVALTGTTLSVGFIAWALRSGAVLAGFKAPLSPGGTLVRGRSAPSASVSVNADVKKPSASGGAK
jgi:hypothetical protein